MALPVREWCNGSTSAFQADGAGSNPVSRFTGLTGSSDGMRLIASAEDV